MTSNQSAENGLNIAIVGGGIIGLVVAAGLARRNVKVTVYEQARMFRELGTGIAFNPSAQGCLEMIDPGVTMALQMGGAVGLSTFNEDDPHDCLRWIDGYNQRRQDDPYYQKNYLKVDAGYRGIQGARRDQFLDELTKLLPQSAVVFQKRIQDIEDRGNDEKLLLKFADGTTAEADAVIGCDGIKSRVRELLVGEESIAGKPTYTHVNSYPTLITMDKAVSILGDQKAKAFHNHLGPNANLLHYPVANGKMCNVTVFVRNPEDWPDDKPTSLTGSKKDIQAAYKDWSPVIRNLIEVLPDQLPMWAVFDLWDYPLPFYNKGRVCVAGDAAHASSPHHGAGAGMGIEDALCLSTLIAEASLSVRQGRLAKSEAIATAFQVYDANRRVRSQWLVNSSRRVCDLHQQKDWAEPNKWLKAETTLEEIRDRTDRLWNFDYKEMIRKSVEEYGGVVTRLHRDKVQEKPVGTKAAAPTNGTHV